MGPPGGTFKLLSHSDGRTEKRIKSDQSTLIIGRPVRTVPVGVGAAHVAPLMRGDLARPQK